MIYFHLVWIVNLDTAGVLRCVILLRSAREKFCCLLSKIYLMLWSLTQRMLMHLTICKRKKRENPKTLNPVHLSLCFFSLYATNFSRNIHLSLLMMAETPHSQEWWPEWPSKPVCHYCWPVAHFYPPVISRPPWEETASSREGEGAKGVWEAEIERQEKQGWRVVGKVRGQQQALGEFGEEKR